MRIQIKNPQQAAFNQTVLSIFLLLTPLAAVAGVLWYFAGSWNTFISTVKPLAANFFHDEPVICLLILGGAGLLLAGACVAVFEWKTRRRKEKKSPPFTAFEFAAPGMTLENKDPHRNVFLPYAETDLAVQVHTAVRSGRKGALIRMLTGITLSFTHADKTLSVTHLGDFSFLRQILEEGKKFRSLRTSVQAESSSLPEAKELADFVREQMANYLSYGLMLRYTDSQMRSLLLFGLFLLVFGLGLSLVGYTPVLLFKRHWHARMLFPLGIVTALTISFIVWGICNILRWNKDRLLRRRLRQIKGANK